MRLQSLAAWVVTFFCCTSEGTRLLTVPSVPFQSHGDGSYSGNDLKTIIVDSRYASSVDKTGQTFIPPTLERFAQTFQDDLASLLNSRPRLIQGRKAEKNSIFITIDEKGLYLDAAKRHTSEGYTLKVDKNGISLIGASPLGAWWGTRTILQALALRGRLPFGSTTDAPGWGQRGIMLDLGRHYYPPNFLVEMCSFASFFKQNEFHLHLSDNLFINHDLYTEKQMWELYSSFRLNSPNPALAGLASLPESYTRAQFEEIQRKCASRGVTIVPELEAPAHALAISKWKPHTAIKGNPSMLNISHPDTVPALKAIWKTFLPWFHSKTVHIGADEYNKSLVSEYGHLVNELSDLVSKSGKEARIWGTFPPNKGGEYSKDIIIQHWAPYEDNAYFDFIKEGYSVVNSDFSLYVNTKWHGYFGQSLNKTIIFSGNPAGGAFSPNVFDVTNATNNPSRDNPKVMGHIAAQWSDYGPSASTYLEAYYTWRDGLPALADKTWGGDLSEEAYNSIIEKLIAVAPGQNLDRRIKSKTQLILDYRLQSTLDYSAKGTERPRMIRDSSGNRYDAVNHGCNVRHSVLSCSPGSYLETPLSSKGRNYSLSFWVYPQSQKPGALFSGPDSALWAGYGTTTNVTLLSGNQAYSLNYTLPVDTWTRVVLSGLGESTFLTVSKEDGEMTMEFLTKLQPNGVPGSNGVMTIWRPIAIEAPLKRMGGGFTGKMKDISLRGSV